MFLIKNFFKQSTKNTHQSCFSHRGCTSQKKQPGCITFNDCIRIGSYIYREQDILGKGYSSKVYKGTSINKQDEKYAIKVINIKKMPSANLALIEGQIEVHRNLNHPNIVKFYDVYKTQNYYYIITEYCPHGDLYQYLLKHKQLEQNKVQDIFQQIISGYYYLNSKKVIHRDLKPANIFKKGNLWKIGDFGFSIVCPGDCLFDKVNVGTPLYMPPESLKSNKYSFKSDIFAIGIILYQLLTHNTPWPCQTQVQLYKKMRQQKITFDFVHSSLLNKFITRACEVNEFKRLSSKDFQKFMKELINPEDKDNQKKIGEKQLGVRNQTCYQQLFKDIQQNELHSPKLVIKPSEVSTELSEHEQKNSNNNITLKNYETYKQKNTKILLQEIKYCKFIFHMIKNIQYFKISDIKTQKFICLTFFRYLLRILKQLQNPNNNIINKLVCFASYQNDKQYKQIQEQINKNIKIYERQYLDFLKNTDLETIRAVNQQFPELSYTSALDSKFYEKYNRYIVENIKILNRQIVVHANNQLYENISINARYQAIQSLYLYCGSIEEQVEGNKYNHIKGFKKLCGDVVHDYGTSKLGKNDFLTLRQKIISL